MVVELLDRFHGGAVSLWLELMEEAMLLRLGSRERAMLDLFAFEVGAAPPDCNA